MDSEQELREMYRAAAVIKEICNRRTEDDSCRKSMSFSMFFSVFLGVNPIAEVSKLLKAMRRGEVHRLVIGPKAYGTNKWVITKLSNALERYDNRGNLLVASVNVTMNSYAAR